MGVNNKNRLRVWVTGVALLLIAAIMIIFIAGQVARYKLAKQYPAPGFMVTAHNHKLHLHCEGKGPVTVFLVAGLNEFSLHWSGLQPLLARETKTCSYDRAGLGWSEPAEHAPALDNSVSDLHELLQARGDKSPVVLVGHSYGAVLVRLYAQRFPENIKAIVLLDPASEYMPERIIGYAAALESATTQFRHFAPLASLGLIALSAENIPSGLLRGEAIEQYRAVLASGSFFEATSAETAEMINNLQTMQSVGQQPLVKIPVVVISRGLPEPIPGLPLASAQSLEQVWSQLQAELVDKMHAKQIIAEKSGHSIQLTQPSLVFETIRRFTN